MSGKQSGLGFRFLVGGYDLSGDIQALDKIAGGPALLDVTDITEYAHERIGGLRDGSMSFSEYMDPANAHPVLSALPVSDVLMTALVPPLTVIGSPGACLNAKQVGYDPERGADGSLLMKTEGQGNGYGLEWGVQLTAGLRTDSTATDGDTFDNGASCDYGAQAYLQLTDFTGTSVTVTVEHSADGDTWDSLMAFDAQDAAPASGRISVANDTTVDEYLRVSTTGTFTLATFSVIVCVNRTAVVF